MIYVLVLLAGVIIGTIVSTVYFRDNILFYRKLSTTRGMQLVELRSQISRMKKQLGEPEDLIYG